MWARRMQTGIRKIGLVVLATILATAAGATADGCARVRPTPDGFQALRSGSARTFEQVTRLFPGNELRIDTATCEVLTTTHVCDKDLVHVTSVRRIDAGDKQFTQGWAYLRFVRPTPCPD